MMGAGAGMFIRNPLFVLLLDALHDKPEHGLVRDRAGRQEAKRLGQADKSSFIWGSMLMGLVNFVNQKPMRQGKDAGSPLATLGYVCIHRYTWTTIPRGSGQADEQYGSHGCRFARCTPLDSHRAASFGACCYPLGLVGTMYVDKAGERGYLAGSTWLIGQKSLENGGVSAEQVAHFN